MSTINTARSERRTRLKLVLAEPAETETLERILHTRLRERRERRGAMARREAEHQKQAPWVDPREIAGEGNPHELETAVRSGRVRIRFVHTSRWWQRKEATPREAIRLGSDGRSLVNSGHWELRINEDDWRAYLEKTAATAPPGDVPPIVIEKVQLRDASDDEVRVAIKAVYAERGDERPNTKKIVPLVLDRLKTEGLYAKWDTVRRIIREKEFQDRRNRVGRPPRKLKKVRANNLP
jgi:hypothetical protein